MQPLERRARLRQIYEDIWSLPWGNDLPDAGGLRPTKLQALKHLLALPELDPTKPWYEQRTPRSVALPSWLNQASPTYLANGRCFARSPEAQRDLFKMLSRLLDNAKEAGLAKVKS